MSQNDTRANRAQGSGSDEAMADAVSSIQLIESLLGGDEDKKAAGENSFALHLGRILDLLPPEYVTSRGSPDIWNKKIVVTVRDLFDQLAKGRVSVTVARLVFGVPADLLSPSAYAADHVEVPVPLSDVVAAIDPAVLEKHMAQTFRRYNLAVLQDPFKVAVRAEKPEDASVQAKPISEKAPVAEPVAEAPTAEPLPVAEPVAEVPTAEPLPVAEPVAEVPTAETLPVEKPDTGVPVVSATESVPARKTIARRKPVPTTREPSDLGVEPEEVERLGGVNLNLATPEQLMTIEGVTAATARNIVDYRAANGPFHSVFDLGHIPGLGQKTFRKITGMPYSSSRCHRRRKLASMLKLPMDKVADLTVLTRALAERLHFLGCVISDPDGLLLAQSGSCREAEAFGAVVPGILRQVGGTTKMLDLGDIEFFSICLGEKMFTVAVSGRIYLTCIHQSHRLTKTQLTMFVKVAGELAWLLSHRGYVGRSQ